MKFMRSGGTERERRFMLVLDAGDEISAILCEFAERQRATGQFVAVGAVSSATIAFWNPATRKYENTDVDEQMEVVALTGNVARVKDGFKVHAHIVLGMADGRAKGGHLITATVRPTLEVHFVETVPPLERTKDQATGLDLLTM